MSNPSPGSDTYCDLDRDDCTIIPITTKQSKHLDKLRANYMNGTSSVSYETSNNSSNPSYKGYPIIEGMTTIETTDMNTAYNDYKNTFDIAYNQSNSALFTWNQINNQLLLSGYNSSNNTDGLQNDVYTTDRKTFYEIQTYNKLELWHSILKWIYAILLMMYIVGIFVGGSQQSTGYKVIILVLFILFPLLVEFVLYTSYAYLMGTIYGRPKDNIPIPISAMLKSATETYWTKPFMLIVIVIVVVLLIAIRMFSFRK